MFYFVKRFVEPFGDIIAISTDNELVGISCDKSFIEKFSPFEEKELDIHIKFFNELDEYLNKKRQSFSVKTRFVFGTAFQKSVWEKLSEISYSEKLSYKKLANLLDSKAYRSVGSACSENPLPLVFPCHRVINSNGKLGKYSLGNDLKPYLLELEQVK